MTKRTQKKTQTTLAFSPLADEHPAKARQPAAVRSRAAAITLSVSPSPQKSKTHALRSLPTPRKSSQNGMLLSSSPSRPKTTSSTSSFMAGGAVTTTPQRKSRNSTILPIPDDSESDGSNTITQSSIFNRKRQITFDDSDSDEVVSQPKKKQKHVARPATIADSDSDEVVVTRSRATQADSKRQIPHTTVLDESDSDEVVVQPRQKSSNAKQQTTRALESESDGPTNKRLRASHHRQAKHKMSLPQELSSDSESVSLNSEVISDERAGASDEEDDDLPRSSQRMRLKNKTPPKQLKRRDRTDLEEDLDFLKSSDTPSTTRRSAMSKRAVKQNALEVLKQKRLRQHQAANTAAKDSRRIQLDSSDDEEEEEVDNDDMEEETYLDLQDEDLDQNEEDFVIEDDDSAIGAPVDLPFEFSRFKTMKAEDLFKYVVEWMVQKKINPAFAMTDEVYDISFQRLDDFVRGMGGSKFVSSAWTSEFSRALKSRPVIQHDRFINSGFLHDRCDACNRSGHPATWEVRFTGNRYDHKTLDEDSDDDSDDDTAAEEHKMFYIGKFCMQNARTAHALAHWRYHLNEWVIDYLRNEGYLTAQKIVERDSWTAKKRRKYANKIADRMEAEGEVKRLHRDFRNEINTAQYANDNY